MSASVVPLKDEGTRLQVVSAGAIAGLISRFIIAPLDVVKIRLQLQPHSLTDPLEPLRDAPAYRGAVATVKHILKHEGITGLWKGNVPAEIMYGPTRMRYVYGNIPEYKSARKALVTIVRTEGFRGLFKGLPISLIKSAPASAVTVWTYERALGLLISMDEKKDM
ncbi:unnamed protein product [Clonostachys rosea f. rosea IK726]|uniref:Mitochondrial thiamine pyrophosphate carrier 1 n=2 Tax=Bionectria ochroleuca TaxID=29856 RepID=A0A0B7JQ26_BIOOC|nr:unnamed protein product [Clonostachys rosea f. rosea IK726]